MDKKEIKKEFADKLIAKYKDYDIEKKTEYWNENDTNYEGIYLIIKNPNGDKNIKLMYDGNHVSNDEMILSCSNWHIHFYNYYFPVGEEEIYADYFVRDVSKYVDEIFQGKELQTL